MPTMWDCDWSSGKTFNSMDEKKQPVTTPAARVSTPDNPRRFEPLEIPPEIMNAALLLERWFKTRGEPSWEFMGICSRDYAEKLRQIQARLDSFKAAQRNLLEWKPGND